jgi:hypothetical protein
VTLLSPKLPFGAKILFNSLHDTKAPSYLTDDLFAAELPGGVFVDVGWFPECDPSGAYEICVYKNAFENQLAKPIKTKDPHEAAAAVEKFAEQYGRPAPISLIWGVGLNSVVISDPPFQTTSPRDEEYRASKSYDSERVPA